MTVAEARDKRVCRICEQPIHSAPTTLPKGWETQFGEMVFPGAITMNYGEEFAHTGCLKVGQSTTESAS